MIVSAANVLGEIDGRAAVDPQLLQGLIEFIRVSVASALLGAAAGLIIALAVIRGKLPDGIRSTVMTFSGVASQFAGIPLAFAFIATLNRLPAKETEHLPRKKDGTLNGYALGIAAMNAHRFETDQLVRGMEACLQANLALVTTQLDQELVLTEIVVKLLT